MNTIEETLKEYQRKSSVFVNVINSVDDETIWGIQDVNEDLWRHFNGEWLLIKPYLVDMDKTFDFIEPDIYIRLTKESKRILSELLLKYPESLNYFWHNIFFKDDYVFVKVIEGCESMYISKTLNINNIQNSSDWVDFI